MSEQAVLWIFGLLIGSLFAILGAVAKAFWARLATLEKGQQSTDLAAFIGRFNATEGAWNLWRASYIDETQRRRLEIDRRLDAHAIDLKDHQHRITRLERNGH